MRPTKTQFFIMALTARGYSEVTRDPLADTYRVFSIYHFHPKRLGTAGDRIYISPSGAVRVGRSWVLGKPLLRETKRNLIAEAEYRYVPSLTETELLSHIKTLKKEPH